MRVMVVAGGSGGHIFPAVGFCQELKETHRNSVDIIFVTTAGKRSAEFIPKEFNPVFLRISKRPLGILKLLMACFSLMAGKKPQVVFGFGGYMSVPFLLWAKVLGKKTLIHEQNVVPGKANMFLSRWVDQIAISFPGTEKYFKAQRNKVLFTRFPLRKSLGGFDKEEALKFFGFVRDRFTVLVVGGSQGAHPINEKFLAALKINQNISGLQIIHIAGEKDFRQVEEAYGVLAVKSKVFAFLAEMNCAYAAADLVISRSGAGAVSEIIRFGLPSILIPYPYAGAHQKENAKVLAQRGASILLEEEKMTAEMISQLLDIFKDDTIRRKTMAQLARALYEASQNLKLSDLIFL